MATTAFLDMATRIDLVEAMRATARWRRTKARAFANARIGRHRSYRVMTALQVTQTSWSGFPRMTEIFSGFATVERINDA
jgi:hypothetical protein